MGLCLTGSCEVARSRPLLRILDHLSPHGIQDDIPANLQEVAVLLDEDSFIPPLEQMANPAVPFVEELGVDSIQLPHAVRKVSIGRFNKKMKVIGHETVGVANPVVAFFNVLNGIEEVIAILIVLEDGLLLVAAGRNVINGAWIFYTERTGHGQ
jgi:hypothetical protein